MLALLNYILFRLFSSFLRCVYDCTPYVWFIKRPARTALTLLPSTLITLTHHLIIIVEGAPLVISKSYCLYGARH